MPDYAELHCHSCFSLREGASTPGELVAQARLLGYRALALTDHDAVYGSMEFSNAANQAGLPGISGAEITLADGHHLTLLASDATGWSNLCQILSHAYLDHGKDDPRVERHVLAERAAGLIALSGCKRGEVPALLQAGRDREALKAAAWYRDCFGPGDFYLEMQRNYVLGDRRRTAALLEMANTLHLPYVATNNAHYHLQERHRLQDILVAIRHRTTLQASHPLRRENAEYYLKSPRQMAELFADLPQALASTVDIAERCQFNLLRDVSYDFPTYQIPSTRQHDQPFWDHYRRALIDLRSAAEGPGSSIPTGAMEFAGYTFGPQEAHVDAYLEAICREALDRRFPSGSPRRPEAELRLAEELRLIRKHRLSGFFLTYYDLLDLAAEIAHQLRGRDMSLPPDVRPVGRGRGSSVSSLVCYLIGLSHIDPLAHNLFLGRFLNEELASVPDIDLDLPRDVREELLKRVWQHFDRDRAALLCSFATYRVRSAIRDVGKALDLPPAEVAKLAKLSDMWGSDGVAAEMARLPEFAEKMRIPAWRHLVDQATQLAGFPRHVSQHVGGMVLSRSSIKNSVPVEPARMDGRFVIQWDKDSVDDARMVKIDFLALGMLSLVDDCLTLIGQRGKAVPDLGRIDHQERAVYDRVCEGDTVGIFQIESRAQIQSLPMTQPRTLDDLAVQVAIIRPGPIVGGAFHPYMEYRRRLRQGEPVRVRYLAPCLEPVLKDTLGVILFQDQVIQVAMEAAGFSVGEAERLRRAMSRRRSREAMSEHWPKFRDGCWERHRIPEATAGRIFDALLGFAAFGFPRSHAVAFALLAYESAWLRYHHPEEYYCALFNNQPMGFYTPEVLVGDARRHGVRFLPPSANHSQAQCSVEGDGRIRLGFASVKGIRLETARAIAAERDAHGSFASLFLFSQRTGCARDQIENLIMVGAFDELGLERRDLLWQLGLFFRPRPRSQPQLDLPLDQDMVRLRPLTDWERLRADYELLGLSADLHPLALLRPSLRGTATSQDLPRLRDGQPATAAGLIVCRQRPGTASGIVFMLLEDEFGVINVVVYSDLFDAEREVIRLAPFVKVHGQVQWRGPNVNLLARHFEPLAAGPRLAASPELLAPAAHNFH
ncbi:MAG: DNA polymerase III subunit alpha [Chloroflexota bacterium]